MDDSADSRSEQVRLLLRDVRQRIVELQAVRAYLEESSTRGPLLADLDAMLASKLAEEVRLMEDQNRERAKPRKRPASRLLALWLVLRMMDETVLGALEFASNGLQSLVY